MDERIIKELNKNEMVKRIVSKNSEVESVNELLAISLYQTFDIVYRCGGHMQYVLTEILTDMPRGNINMTKSIQTGAYARGMMYCKVYKKNINNRYTQIMKLAMSMFLEYEKASSDKMSEKTKKRFMMRMNALREVSDIVYSNSLLRIQLPVCYKPVMSVCKIIFEECKK